MKYFALKTYSLILLLFLAFFAQGQDASAVIDRDKIRIGEQAVIKLSVRFDKANPPAVNFPPIGDTLVEGVEVVHFTTVDTLETGAGVKESRMEQQLFITSFDSGYYAIPPFIIDINGVPTKTEAFLLTVETVAIDTTKGIVDVREIYEVEIDWLDFLEVYWPYAAGGLALVAILVVAIVLFVRYRKRKRLRPAALPPEPLKTPHAIALETLRRIQEEKAYKTGDVKDYHTSITDTLRTYLENGFGIHAHELTTRQILDKLRYSGIAEPQLRSLRTILFRADMVKFAKEKPDYTDNEEAVSQAIDFVKATIAIPAVDAPSPAIASDNTQNPHHS